MGAHSYILRGLKICFLISFTVFCLSYVGFSAVKSAGIDSAVKLFQSAKNGTYLVLFMNNSELRPGGGFIGSFARVSIKDGILTEVAVDTNIYKRDNAFTQKFRIEPPEPLKRVNHDQRWAMRDGNWAADFAESAQYVQEFYLKEGGTPVDGVVGITLEFAQNLLRLTGPIPAPDGSVILTADNLFSELQYRVEKGYFNKPENISLNEPKTVIAELFPLLLRKATTLNPLQASRFVFEMAKEKQLMVWFKDKTTQEMAQNLNWAGRVPIVEGNFFATVNAAMDQTKSSRSIEQKIELTQTRTNQYTQVKAEVLRTHNGSYIWPDGDDINYFQAMLPGSAQIDDLTLNGKSLIGIREEIEKTPTGYPVIQQLTQQNKYGKILVGFWCDTRVGTSTAIEISYRIPATDQPTLVWKQLGSENQRLRLISENSLRYDGEFNQDMLIK